MATGHDGSIPKATTHEFNRCRTGTIGGWGNKIAGTWDDWDDPGTYVAKYFVGGVLVAQGEFEVY